MDVTKSLFRICTLAGLAALAVHEAHAIDGTTLIDQNKALAGSVTPGDTPGFPVTITRGGSYRLSSNLTVPDHNTTAILLSTEELVTIDLNGFAILGPNVCNPLSGCTLSGLGKGIWTGTNFEQHGHSVFGGAIHGMGSIAIQLSGFGHTVRDMRIRHNRGGIETTAGIIHKNIVEFNSIFGISASLAVVTEKVVFANNGVAISLAGGTASDNSVMSNAGFGFQSLELNAGFKGNFFRGNNNNGIGAQVSGGTQLGPNICGSGLCP